MPAAAETGLGAGVPSAGPGASAHSRRELPSSSGGPTPPTVGAPPTGSQEWASAGPGASTCPHGSGVVGVDGLLVQAGVGGSVLRFGPERDPPANPACSLPLKSLRSVRMGLRSTVPTKLFPPASSPPHTDAHPFLIIAALRILLHPVESSIMAHQLSSSGMWA